MAKLVTDRSNTDRNTAHKGIGPWWSDDLALIYLSTPDGLVDFYNDRTGRWDQSFFLSDDLPKTNFVFLGEMK